jgi:aminobenzoyl-glutamate transport protein
MNRYKREEDPEFGLGTLISYMLPYTIVMAVVLIALMIGWMMLGYPLGPGAELFVN